MDITEIKKDFPQFTSNPDLVYLDSAATSLTPEPVLNAMDEYYRTYRANTHRGFYKEAQRATEHYEQARERVAQFIGASSEEIVFTPGATLGANMLAWALTDSPLMVADGEIVLTVLDHHSLLLPFRALAERKGYTVRYLGVEGTSLNVGDIEQSITDKTQLVCISLASNVLGTLPDVPAIVRHAHKKGALVVLDGTAGVGHMPVNVRELGVDFLFFSGHKMCGPTGTGVLYGKKELLQALTPSLVGGGMVEDVTLTHAQWCEGPSRFEAGTQNIAGVIGLGEAVAYLGALGLSNIRSHCEALTAYAQEQIKSVEGVTLFSAPPQENVGIVSLTLQGIHPHDVAEVAGRRGVAVRAGHHCALPLHSALNAEATVRVSLYVYNTEEDIDAFVSVLKETKTIFNTYHE